MSPTVEVRPWDSDFFGIPIGEARRLAGVDQDRLRQLEEEARGRGLRCLYGELDPDDRCATVTLQRQGWRLVDVALTLEVVPEHPPVGCPPGTTLRRGTAADLPAIEPIVPVLAEWSRFGVDPRFGPDQARRMQSAWVERAATDPTGEHALVVAENDAGIEAFVTRHARPRPTVDIAATLAKGSGAARALIQHCRDWAAPGPLLAGPIAARNTRCLRFVEHCGGLVSQVTYRYHRWLDET